MAIGKDKAADHSRSVTAYAVTAVLGCGLLMAPMQSAAQAVNQPATATTPVAVDPNAPVTPTTDTAGTATATATATTPDARTTDADARPNPRLVFDAPDILRTGSILDDDIGRVNMRGSDLNSLRSKARPTDDQQLGIKLGTFTLRPSVNQSYNVETNKGGGTNDHRTYLQSDFENTLTSDWDRHQLTITGNGIWQRNVSGTGEEQPSINLGADLRLDLAEQTTAHLTGGYKFFREDTDDPNALSGATKQSNVNEYDLGASIERDFGLLRGTTAVTLARTVYSDATLADGTLVSLSDRNQTAGTWRGRIGYELSPALIPFLEVQVGKALYDDERDSAGYERSNSSYGAKAGVQLDLGEKLRGELGIGYQHTGFDDARLASIDSPTVDGNIAWSPQRGTDVSLGFATTVQPSTTAGESGYVAYQLTSTVAHQIRDTVTGKITGGTTWRNYTDGSTTRDQQVYDAALGLTWGINRYLDMTSNIGYELTTQNSGDDTRQFRAGLGLTVKR
ncbi:MULTISPECIES: outer membrane beta-barrel protein [unclassified Rhizobium]|uniref:outer membrane beta-barrel protein n=1 Tax=unclassified Rhizobium TaxID=2613769 RepID=UPI001ADA1B9A|nr:MULTISPECIES: outer membrane beta-barrel protein [unclassified Rhizobium]MBO9099723.1 outer membrane beta-barrel protein [Rhizobium sp. L58/93]MBO9131745.1 outer membrane beta-barrel protein [Rhizobium sp. B209b/85]MBO9169713.1 outer membrane beta-barrel protein [Rhizobium sp. L245/93]MBO9185671.1 outer membrane beta-barrel protein [Rhizobium sp. E27B/91]QXZ82436.1 outer membrane beta-barrel protein [Rhizobium sp. K1/93]